MQNNFQVIKRSDKTIQGLEIEPTDIKEIRVVKKPTGITNLDSCNLGYE